MALGGNVVALADSDIALTYDNPTIMDSTNVGDFMLQYSPFLGGVNLLNAGAHLSLPYVRNMMVGLTYINYGEIERTDLLGNSMGTFKPQDFVLYLGKSHRISSFVLGASLKYVHSSIDGFGANALVMDLGGSYHHPTIDLVVAIVLKNLGITFDAFDSRDFDVPLDLQAGISIKPKYMPVRFSINGHHLVADLGYFDQTVGDGETATFANELFRHISLGMEILIGRFLEVLVGYNHLRNQELRLQQGAFGAGLSFGLMIKVKNLNIRYSRAVYHAGGGLNSIGIQGNFSDLKKIF